MIATSCARCSTPFEAKTIRARYCSASCRALDSKDRRNHPQAPAGNVRALPGARGPEDITAAVRAALGSQLESVAGRQAVKLATRLDQGASDSSWSAMSKRLDELLAQAAQAAALAAVKGDDESNPIAYLKARGERRRVAG